MTDGLSKITRKETSLYRKVSNYDKRVGEKPLLHSALTLYGLVFH
jgi:hypothetical protein